MTRSSCRPTRPRSTDFIYFSFITLTTTGYGDLTAAHDLGRMLAVTEALFGQLYLVSAVALLIGSLGRTRGAPGPSGEPDVLDELGALADVPAEEPTNT